MGVVNQQSGTRIDEIENGIYRISTPVTVIPGGFSFNQYLIADEAPLLFHSGPRRMFGLVAEAVNAVMPVERLRYIGLSHFEADECGALNEFLAAAPRAVPLSGRIAKMVSVDDFADREGRGLGEGEELVLGQHRVTWLDAPHVPHGWECGFLHERSTGTLLCGDLFTQPGATHEPLTENDILEPSEAMRRAMDYFSHGERTGEVLEKLAALEPRTLACMHGSAWRGNGAQLIRALGERLRA
jgi:flavorubredoxin